MTGCKSKEGTKKIKKIWCDLKIHEKLLGET